VLVDLAVVGVCLSGCGAGVSEDQVTPSAVGQLAALAGERGDLGGSHHGVEHAAVEGAEARALPFADGGAGLKHRRDQGRAAHGARVEGVFGRLRGCPAFGQVVLAQRVLGESLLADRVTEGAVQHPAAPGEVFGGGGLAVQVDGQGVEDIGDD
jgi:hypothetical protein